MSTARSWRRSRFPLLLAAVALLGGITAGWWMLQGGHGPDDGTATVLQQPRQLPEFALVDGDGRAFNRERLAEGWHLLFFGFTNCPDICPATLTTLKAVDASLGNEVARPQMVFVSVDPARDDKEAVGRYVRFFDSGFVGVTGRIGQIRRLTDALYLPFAHRGGNGNGEYMVDHSATLALIGPDARVRAYFSPPHRPEPLAAALRDVINRG